MMFLNKSVFELLIILKLLGYAICSDLGRAYHDGTTPEEGPTTIRPDANCELSKLDCLNASYTARNSFPSEGKTILSLPNYHNFERRPHLTPEPIKTLPDGSVIIDTLAVTNKGTWDEVKSCPKGMYAMTVFWDATVYAKPELRVQNYIHFGCRRPGETETVFIETWTGSISTHRNKTKNCKGHGALVGFAVRGKKPRGVNDFGPCCSTNNNIDFEKRHLSQTGIIEAPFVYCKRYQAICGMQAQIEDKIGFHRLNLRCCTVENPYKDCVPTENRIHIRTCNNTDGTESLLCDFESKIGLSLNYVNENEKKALIFYSSIGYDFLSIHGLMKEKIISILKTNSSNEYHWNDVSCKVEEFESTSLKIICLKSREFFELYQIVGKCRNFMVRTNRFVKVFRKGSEEYVDIQ